MDDDFLWCTLVVGEKGIEQAKEFSESFRVAGGQHYLGLFAKDKAEADLCRAFEIDGARQEIREQLGKHLLAKGCRAAAFLVLSPDSGFPDPDDPLGKFLAKVKDPHWDEAMRHFEAEKPNLEKALDGFFLALDTRYTDPDALNYAGACLRELGWNRQATVFLQAAVKQSKNKAHRYALTNLGLALLDLDRPDEARPHLQQAVAAFPDEAWTEKARQALNQIDARSK
jgi:tetratricopeptide (TPR) repeat protein